MIRSVLACRVAVCFSGLFLLFGYLDFDRFVLVFIEQYRWHIQFCLANKLLLVHSFVMQKNEINDIFFISPKNFMHSKKICYGNKNLFFFFSQQNLAIAELYTLRIWIGFFVVALFDTNSHIQITKARKKAVINFGSFLLSLRD